LRPPGIKQTSVLLAYIRGIQISLKGKAFIAAIAKPKYKEQTNETIETSWSHVITIIIM
jgi:hypothetical protein